MSASVAQASRREGVLLLADISGYTGFLQGVADAHRDLIIEAEEPPPAYAVLSHLLDTMVVAIEPTFRLAKFEGDAIFAVTDDGTVDGQAVLDAVHRCYDAFRGAVSSAGSQWTCRCNGCARIVHLDLKFVVHHGTYVAQPIAGREEFLGPDVNLAHRLLKNHVHDVLGVVPYALFTDAAARALAIPTDGMVNSEEAYADTPTVRVHVLPLAEPG